MAYGDFITTMMALFLVLWLTAQDKKIKEAVERAFRNPFSSVTHDSVGIVPNDETQAVKSEKGNFSSSSAVELRMLRRLNQDLMKSFEYDPSEENKNMKLELTSEGLMISLFDNSRKPIFQKDTAEFTSYGRWIFSTLAWEVSRYSVFKIELAGHTEKGHKPPGQDYGNWELSADRANAARRELVLNGVENEQIAKVSGFADKRPMKDYSPYDEENRRVTVLLKLKQNNNNESTG